MKNFIDKVNYILDKPAEEIFTPKVLMIMCISIPVIVDLEFILVLLLLSKLAGR